jgi:hypothetical protein
MNQLNMISYLHDNQLISYVSQLLSTGNLTELNQINCQRVRNIFHKLSTLSIHQLPKKSLVYLIGKGYLDMERCEHVKCQLDLEDITQIELHILIEINSCGFLTVNPIIYDQIDHIIDQPEKMEHIMTCYVTVSDLEQWAMSCKCHIIDIYHQYHPEPIRHVLIRN